MLRKFTLVILCWVVVNNIGCATSAQVRSESATGQELAPCPDSPNCVSTQSKEPGRAMPPLPYKGTRQDSLDRLHQVVRDMKRSSVVVTTPTYLRAEFRSALFGFVDDVEFLFDDRNRRIHFRSASRTGYYDFGVNRRRMQEIARRFLEE